MHNVFLQKPPGTENLLATTLGESIKNYFNWWRGHLGSQTLGHYKDFPGWGLLWDSIISESSLKSHENSTRVKSMTWLVTTLVLKMTNKSPANFKRPSKKRHGVWFLYFACVHIGHISSFWPNLIKFWEGHLGTFPQIEMEWPNNVINNSRP